MKVLPLVVFAALMAVPAAREVRRDKFDDTHLRFEAVERAPFTCATGEPAALGVGAVALGLVLRRRR